MRAFSLPVGREIVRGFVHPPSTGGLGPAVILCHGFKGFMDWGFFPHLAELLSARGFCVLRFNFSGSGMQPGDELVTDVAAFGRATFSKDLAELEALMHSLESIAPEVSDPQAIGLVGHSRGGGIALLASAAADSPVKALVTWAAVATFDRLPAEAIEHWQRDGRIPIVNARTGQVLALDIEVLEDLREHAAKLDPEAAAARRKAPWLLVHGHDDETVPFAEAVALRSAAAEPAELLGVEGADHTLGVKHPFSSPTPQLIEAMNATQVWLRRHLV